MRSPTETKEQSKFAWPLAITTIVVVAIIALTALLVVRQIARVPQLAAEQAKGALTAMVDLAAAFRQGTVETDFRSFVTTISGSTYLQVAAVDRVELFKREDRAAIFWGALQLPEIVVSASAPVHYTAYVDLEEPWELRLENDTLEVVAPPIRFNRPAIDISNIEFEIEEDSLLRDEDAAIEALQRELTSQSHHRTRELVPIVRETARSKIAGFVDSWLLQSFPDATAVRIEVFFVDEMQPRAPVLRPAPAE